LAYHVGYNVLQNFISNRAAPGLSYELRQVDAEAMLSYYMNGGDQDRQQAIGLLKRELGTVQSEGAYCGQHYWETQLHNLFKEFYRNSVQ